MSIETELAAKAQRLTERGFGSGVGVWVGVTRTGLVRWLVTGPYNGQSLSIGGATWEEIEEAIDEASD